MTRTQAAIATYQRAHRDARRLTREEPDSLARCAAECAAELALDAIWAERMVARSAKP